MNQLGVLVKICPGWLWSRKISMFLRQSISKIWKWWSNARYRQTGPAEIFGVSLDYLVLGKEPEKEIVVENKLGKWMLGNFKEELSGQLKIKKFFLYPLYGHLYFAVWILTMITKIIFQVPICSRFFLYFSAIIVMIEFLIGE